MIFYYTYAFSIFQIGIVSNEDAELFAHVLVGSLFGANNALIPFKAIVILVLPHLTISYTKPVTFLSD
jgi:hypothetical protein